MLAMDTGSGHPRVTSLSTGNALKKHKINDIALPVNNNSLFDRESNSPAFARWTAHAVTASV